MVDHREGDGGASRVGEVFTLLSRAHMLDLLHTFACHDGGPLRFNELEEELQISPNTLSVRLKELVEAGLVERNAYDEIPPRVEYEATAKGQALDRLFDEIEGWAREHDLEPAAEAV